MTDWRSPHIILSEYNAYVRLIHFLGGLYLWEILINLDFDYAIFTRKRNFRASSLLYLLARWTPLINIVMAIAGQDSRPHYLDCRVYVSFIYVFVYSGFLFGSSLFILRIAAIWEHNKVVITLAWTTWLINFIACIYCAATTRSVWVETLHICGLDMLKTKTSLISIFIAEVVLLVLMLTGLLRWKRYGRGSVWHLLFTQGVIWVVVTTVANIPPLILIFLNLDFGADIVAQVPGTFIVTIAATRMYRGLSDYLGRTDIFHSTHVLNAGGPSRSRPIMDFVVPPSTDVGHGTIPALGDMQSDGRVSVTGSVTVTSSETAEKAASGGDEAV